MRRLGPSLTPVLSLSLAALACAGRPTLGIDEEGGTDEGTDTILSTTGESGTAEGSGDGDGDTTSGDGDGDTTSGDGDGDTTGDGDGDTSGDGDGDTSGDGDGDSSCVPPNDTPCAGCVADSCCAEIQACELDPDCDCLYACLGEGGGMSCAQTCGANPAENPQLGAIRMCTLANCEMECVGGGDGDGDGDMGCVPANDSPCAVCTADSCCPEVQACEADPDCACLSACLAGGGNPMMCAGQCGANPQDNEPLGALRMCRQANCMGECL